MTQPTRRGRLLKNPHARGRRGSVLVVILAMLGALMLLGFVFFTIAAQEEEAASLFADAQKEPTELGLTADELFDYALEQVIVGPSNDRLNSALWGGRWSLMANLVGTDLQPFDGTGVNLVMDGSGTIGADEDFNGTLAVGTEDLGNSGQIVLNHSLAAEGLGGAITEADQNLASGVVTSTFGRGLPQPDVGYSYPDLNSPFLAYVGTEPTTGGQVIIPSFHRPQYLRDSGVAAADWYEDFATGDFVMRPHAEHRTYAWVDGDTDNDGISNGPAGEDNIVSAGEGYSPAGATGTLATPTSGGYARFLDGSFTDATTSTVYDAFPLRERNPTPDPADAGDEVPLAEGQWAGGTAFEYDADADGDGVFEAVWLDLDFPVQQTADGSTSFVPLFAITIYDLDGLLNLNTHGNLYGDIDLAAGPNFGGGDPVSRSNEGRGPHEVNPQYALTASAASASATHTDFFEPGVGSPSGPTGVAALANMEWFWLLCGRGDADVAGGVIENSFAGRWGRDNGRLDDALRNVFFVGPLGTAAQLFPRPGVFRDDDNLNDSAGHSLGSNGRTGTGTYFDPSVIFPNFGEPADYLGAGVALGRGSTRAGAAVSAATTAAGDARQRSLLTDGVSGIVYPLADQYWTHAAADWSRALGSNFPATTTVSATPPVGLLTTLALFQAQYRGNNTLLEDEPAETLLTDAATGADQVFGPDQTAALHIDDSDWTRLGTSSRVRTLAPANFVDDGDAEEIRGRFTTVSGDYDAFAFPAPVGGSGSVARAFEFNGNWTINATTGQVSGANAGAGNGEFPPVFNTGSTFTGDEPFREEVVAFLRTGPDNGVTGTGAVDTRSARRLLKKLSVNHVAAYDRASAEFFQRPLTPHPTGLASTVVTAPSGVSGFGVSDRVLDSFVVGDLYPIDGSDLGRQEWYARRDRQNLARDIYVLLYTLSAETDPTAGPPSATMFPPGGSSLTVEERLREMAQFAVNVVDRLDGDDVITAFVYDTDLSNGYTAFDDAYDATNGIAAMTLIDLTTGAAPTDWPGDEPEEALVNTSSTDSRGVVFGVERQSLTLSEALAINAETVSNGTTPTDHALTYWDDSIEQAFSFVELKNFDPAGEVLNGRWQVVATVNPTGSVTAGTPALAGPSRALTFLGGTHDIPASDATRTLVMADCDARSQVEVSTSDSIGLTRTGSLINSVVFALTEGVTADPGPNSGTYAAASILPYDNRIAGYDFDTSLGSQSVLDLPATGLSLADEAILDTIHDSASSRFALHDVDNAAVGRPLIGTSNPAETTDPWVDYAAVPGGRTTLSPSNATVLFELRRRVNTLRATPTVIGPPNATEESDNFWITVDSLEVPLNFFQVNDADGTGTDETRANQGEINVASEQIISNERRELLAGGDGSGLSAASSGGNDFDPTRGFPGESLGASSNGDVFQAQSFYQPHGDRPFANLAELFDVPLYGPSELTASLADVASLDRRETAAIRFLYPDVGETEVAGGSVGPDGSTSGTAQYDNLWFRLLSFLDTPTGYGEQDVTAYPSFVEPGGAVDATVADDMDRLGDRFRRFGKVNLNTIRHPHVLMGLLDDTRFVDPTGLPSGGGAGTLTSANGESFDGTDPMLTGVRDWWEAFLRSRDGVDPVGGSEILPGLPPRINAVRTNVNQFFGRPFREGAPLRGDGASMIDHTLSLEDGFYRRLPGDYAGTSTLNVVPRGLFELGDRLTPDTGLVNQDTRHHLLGKVLANATTRSNAYVVFMRVDYFQAFQNDHDGNDATPPLVQIGGLLRNNASPGFRGAFVIDRTLALEELGNDESMLPPDPGTAPSGAATAPRVDRELRNFSFARDEDGEPVFPWRSLVTFRRVIQ